MRRDRDADLSREIQSHLELEAEERIADGLSPRDAQDAARRAFGNVLRVREEARAMWIAPWIEHTFQDLRHSARRLRRAPAFAIAAVGILTAGIGVNLALFQLLNVAALAPLPVADVDTLVRFDRVTRRFSSNGIPFPATQFIRDHNSVLAAVLTSHASDAVWGDDPNDRVSALYVSANWFAELGFAASSGRVFAADDERADAAPVVVVSHELWRDRLQSQGIVGHTVRINDRPATVIGVAPKHFPGLELDDPQVWLLAHQIEYFNPTIPFTHEWSAHNTQLYGRLKPGVSPAAASEGLRGTIQELARLRPAEFEADERLIPYSGRDRFRGPRDRAELLKVALLAGGLTLLVLFVACANLTNLVLSRAIGRRREFALCGALGATRWRLFRQQMVESALFAGLAAIAGLVAGLWLAALVARFWLPAFVDLDVDWRVAAATCGLAFLVTLVVGALPAWLMGRRDVVTSLKDGGHQMSAGATRGRFRLVSIAAQAAGCCVLLLVAGTTVRGLSSVLRPSFGFQIDRIAVLDPSLRRYGIDGEAARAFWNETMRVLEATPELDQLALASVAPLAGSANRSTYTDAPRVSVTRTVVDPAFFAVLGIPIVRGRNFSLGDSPGTVAIVGQRLALEMYGTIDAVGLGFPRSKPERTIVGIAADAPLVNVSATNVAEWYSPIGPRDHGGLVLLARARSTADRLVAPLRDAARAADQRVLPRTWLPTSDLAERVEGRAVIALAANAAGLMALGLACFGIFSVVACAASLRKQEVGIRRALGARGGSIVLLFLRQLVIPLALGVVAGTAAGMFGARVLEGDPFYMPATDARVSLSALAVFIITAGAAAIIPALRALRVDPLAAIRHE
jgi:macrolide transport system ATP-binding/permease protein